MTAREFADWVWYYEIEPFGQMRDNEHMARLGSLLVQVHGGKLEPEELMIRPTFEKEEIRTKATIKQLLALKK